MSFESTSTLQQPDGVSAAAAASSGSLGGGGGGGTGIEVIQLDASGGNVTETLPTPTGGATALALRVDTSTSNTATLDTPGSQEIRFAEGKNVSSTTLGVEQSLLLSSDGNNWYVEEGQGLSAEAEAVTTDAATKDSPSLTQTATYDSDGTTSVTSSDVSIERYVRTDNNGNATLVYESGGTEIARLSSGGRFETRKDQEAFMDGSLSSGQGTNSLLQFEDANNNRSTTDLAKLTVKGSGVTVTNPSTDEYVLDITGGGSGSATDILDNGTEVVADATDINFGGGDFDVSQNANNASRTDVTLTNDSVTVAGNNVSLGGSTGIGHSDLSGISSDDHHSKYTDSDAVTAVGASTPFANSDLSNSSVTVAGNVVNLGNSTAINHGDLSSIGSDDHHPKTTSASDLTDVSADSVTDAHHTRPSAGDGLSDSSNTFSVNESQVDHDSLNQFVANEHVDHSAVTIGAGTALSGGGDLTASRTLNVAGPLTGIPFKTDGDDLEWQADSNDDLILQNTTDSQTLLKVDQDTGTVFAAGDVVAFGLSGGGGSGSTSGLQADAPLTLDTSTDPDTIGLSVGSGLTVNSGTLEADGSVGVSSVFGRTGDITASAGDYSASQISSFDSAAVDALQAHNGTGVDADTLDGVEGSNYARTDQDETVTGAWTIEDELVVSVDGSPPTRRLSSAVQVVRSSFPSFALDDVGENTDEKLWQMYANNGLLGFRLLNDSSGAQTNALTITPERRVGIDEAAPTYAFDVNGTAAASTLRLGDYTVEQDGTDGDLNFFHSGSKVLELTDGGVLRAAGDVVAFGLSGGSGTGSSSGLQANAPLTLDTTTSPDTIGLSVGSGLTVNSGTLEADGSVGVSSVFGRTGDVTASSGDYSASQISGFDEKAQDAVGTIMSGSGAASVTYDDANNTITVTATDTNTNTQTDLESSGGTVVSDANAMSFEAGANSSVTVSSDNDGTGTVTISATDTDTQLSDSEVKTAIESATSDVAISISGDADTLDGVQLSNISFADIAATRYDDEEAQDAVNNLLVGGSGITLSYDDINDELTITSNVNTTDTRVDLENSGGVVVTEAEGISFEAGANASVSVGDDGDGTGTVTVSATDTDTQLSDGEVKTAIENATSDVAIDISGDADTLDGHDESYFGALSENETVTGAWTIEDELVVSVDGSSPTRRLSNAVQVVRGGFPAFILDDVGENTDEKLWQMYANNGLLGFRLLNDSSGAQTNALTITPERRVGIDEAAPAYALEISGDARASGEVEAFLGSDRRLKTALDPLDSALDKVDQLTGYGFDWRGGDAVQPHKRGETDVGLIAQEVEGVLPEAVKEFQDGHSEGYKSVSYDKLVPLLVEAIKDLRSQVNNLQ